MHLAPALPAAPVPLPVDPPLPVPDDGGQSSRTTTPVAFEVDRVAHSGSGSATRTGIYVTDQTRSRYVFFSDDVGEDGWTYNRKINQAGDNPTGGGININAFDGPVFDDLGNHRMKAVADGQTVKLYLECGLYLCSVTFGDDAPAPGAAFRDMESFRF